MFDFIQYAIPWRSILVPGIIVINVILGATYVATGFINKYRPKYEKDSKKTWFGVSCLFGALGIDMLICLFLIAASGIYPLYAIWLFGILVILMFPFYNFKVEIPNNPPTKAMENIWGELNGKVVDSGIKYQFPYWPHYLSYPPKNQVDMTKKRKEFTITTWAKTQGKGAVKCKVKFAIVAAPDPARLCEYVGIGNEAGFYDLVPAVAESQIENYSREKKWEEFISEKLELLETLGTSLTSEKKMKGIEGTPDNHGWGVLIFIISLEDVEPIDETLISAMREVAVEEKQRQSQQYESETIKTLAQQLVNDSGGKLTYDKAFEIVSRYISIREGRVTENREVLAFEGLENAGELAPVVALFQAMARATQRGGGPKGGSQKGGNK